MNELYHHGIIGQKWGVRRYQNKDGTLTEAGKGRHAKNDQSETPKKSANKSHRNRKVIDGAIATSAFLALVGTTAYAAYEINQINKEERRLSEIRDFIDTHEERLTRDLLGYGIIYNPKK